MLAQTFDADVNESIRGTNALMEGFGLTAQQASDLLAAGMQNGLNYTDELADNLSEYSVRWGQAGVSASQYFSLLEAGASNGAYNLDKVGDFLNEFLTSLSDGRLEEHLGQLSSGTRSVFDEFKAGKATAKDVLDSVIGDMRGMTDETQRAALAGELWSALGEDNAMGMILAMGGVEDKYADVAGASEELAKAAGDNFAAKMESAGRTIMGALEPMGEPLLNIARGLANLIGGFAQFFNAIGPAGQVAIMGAGGSPRPCHRTAAELRGDVDDRDAGPHKRVRGGEDGPGRPFRGVHVPHEPHRSGSSRHRRHHRGPRLPLEHQRGIPQRGNGCLGDDMRGVPGGS